MVRITKGKRSILVPHGAFKSMFEPSGWSKSPDSGAAQPILADTDLGDTNPSGTEFESYMEPISSSMNSEDETLSDSVDLDEDLEEEGPSEMETLKTMSLEELKQYASLLELDISSLEKDEEIIQAICGKLQEDSE